MSEQITSVDYMDYYTLPLSENELDDFDVYLLQLEMVVDLLYAADELDEPNTDLWLQHARESLVALMLGAGEPVSEDEIKRRLNLDLEQAYQNYITDYEIEPSSSMNLATVLEFANKVKDQEFVTKAA